MFFHFMWLKNKYNLALLLIIFLTALVYRNSFFSPFFQDDKVLLNSSTAGSFFIQIVPATYRPISQQLFYFLGNQFFGRNVFGYHLVLFGVFALTLVVLFALADKLLKSKTKALIAVFFYAFNISLFANFYWIATSYFSIGALFYFLTLYFYLKKEIKNAFLFGVSFLLALGSNEIAFTIPIIVLLINWYQKYWPKRAWVFLALCALLVVLRAAVIGFPKAVDYTIQFNLTAVATLRWYLLRALNLPEGVDRGGRVFYLLFFIFVLTILISVSKYLRQKQNNLRVLILGCGLFVFGALPFYFLPGHMSSYYLTTALLGPSLILGEVSYKKAVLALMAIYLVMTVLGLNFLSQTHWIILKNTGPIGQF